MATKAKPAEPVRPELSESVHHERRAQIAALRAKRIADLRRAGYGAEIDAYCQQRAEYIVACRDRAAARRKKR